MSTTLGFNDSLSPPHPPHPPSFIPLLHEPFPPNHYTVTISCVSSSV